VLFANVASWLRVRFELTAVDSTWMPQYKSGRWLWRWSAIARLAGRLSELAALLLARFEFSRLDRDLDAAITTAREAVRLPGRPP